MKMIPVSRLGKLIAVACVGLVLSACGEPKTSAKVRIVTKPAKAKIYLNGKYVGRSPCTIEVRDKSKTGKNKWESHLIEAQLAGFEMQNYEIAYQSGFAWVPDVVKLDLTKNKNYKPWQKGKTVTISDSDTTSGSSKKYVSKTAWHDTAKKDIDLTKKVNELASDRKRDSYTAKTPWQKADDQNEHATAKVKTFDPKKSKHASATDLQNFQCELRLIRVSDGKLITQQSAMASVKNSKKLTDILIGRLLRHLPEQDVSIATISLCNRRRTKNGRALSVKLTDMIEKALENSDQFDRVLKLDLRGSVENEMQLESATNLTGSTYRALLGGARYIIIGGVALQRVPDSLNESDAIYGKVKQN